MLFKGMKSANACSKDGSETRWIHVQRAGLGKSFRSRSKSELFYAISATSIFRGIKIRLRIPVGYFERARVGNSWPHEAIPICIFTDSARRNHAETGDGNAMSDALHGVELTD
jgi:hypothetical protein